MFMKDDNNQKKIVYIGNDTTFFKNLENRINLIYPNQNFIYKSLFTNKRTPIACMVIPMTLLRPCWLRPCAHPTKLSTRSSE